MTIVIAIVVALVLVFLAFSFLKGVIKLGTVAIVVMLLAIVAHKAGAF